MADKRITELSAVSAIDIDNDLLLIVNNGYTKKITPRHLGENLEPISYQGSDLKALSANWQSTYTTVTNSSSFWESSYTAVAPNSANWQNVYTDVVSNSANWENTYTAVASNSANWQDTHTTVSSNSAIWGAVEFNNDVTYVNVLTGLNEMLRLTVNGVTRYIRLFDVGPEQFLFASESAVDNIITEDGNDQLMFNLDPELFLFGTEDGTDVIVGENNQYTLRFA